jgi:hypothetical protein
MHVTLYVDERGESCKTIYGNLLLKLLDTTLCKKFVLELRQVGGFLRVLRLPIPIKLSKTRYN